ncbi:MAG: hypothetical protein EKK64_04780 [Neisseriaceae bacterium]|nr:MAG: hypothetical protein EKK64_04780 [Neisseriaceae bacterium]
MGTRVNKVLGWGLIDVKTKSEKIIDPRFNKEGFLFEDYEMSFNQLDLIEELKKAKDEKTLDLDLSYSIKALNEKKSCIYDIVHYNCKKTICFASLWNEDHRRHDDPIDYHEECAIAEKNKNYSLKDKVLLLNSGIYPFLSYMDSRTGKKLGDFAFHAKRLINTGQQVDEHTLAVLGFKDTKECKEFMHPVIPDSLIVSLKYLKIFNDDNTIFQLRPMIFTFWR